MSMAANKHLIESLREEFSTLLTASDMEKIVDIIEKTLTEYSLERIVVDDANADYMVDAYIDAIGVEGKSKSTLCRYQYEIKRMLKAVGVSSANITAYHVRKYLSDSKVRGVADSTIKSVYQVLNAYFGWLHRDGLIKINPMNNISTPKEQKKIKETYSDLDIESLKEGCHTLRDKAIICLLKSSGCRIGEIVRLNRDDIDYNNREFVVLGKGNKQRTVYIDMITAKVLKQYIDSRKDDIPALFIGCRKERLEADGIRSMLRVLGKELGIKKVHPHKFRRTEATELARRGMPIEQIRQFLGHEKIDTTLRYVVTDQDDVRHNYRRLG